MTTHAGTWKGRSPCAARVPAVVFNSNHAWTAFQSISSGWKAAMMATNHHHPARLIYYLEKKTFCELFKSYITDNSKHTVPRTKREHPDHRR